MLCIKITWLSTEYLICIGSHTTFLWIYFEVFRVKQSMTDNMTTNLLLLKWKTPSAYTRMCALVSFDPMLKQSQRFFFPRQSLFSVPDSSVCATFSLWLNSSTFKADMTHSSNKKEISSYIWLLNKSCHIWFGLILFLFMLPLLFLFPLWSGFKCAKKGRKT